MSDPIYKIGEAPNGEKTSLDGTEKVPLSGSVWATISRWIAYLAGEGTLATKSYVDGIAVNLGKRQRVRVATTANITISTALNNGDTLDGVTLVTGDLVLVKDQSSASLNGVYVVGASPARAAEFDTYDEHPGSLIAVQEGTANEDTIWLCTSNVGGTLNTTAIDFATFTATVGNIETLNTAETDTALVLAPDGAGGVEFRAETGGGGGGSGTIYDRRWARGSMADALDDEFNDDAIDGAWSRVDNSGHSGYVTWTEAGDSLSLLLGNTGDAAAELHAYLKSHAMATGDYIQCHLQGGGKLSDYPIAGLIIADGNTYGAGVQAFFPIFLASGATWGLSPSEWSGFNTRVAFTDYSSQYFGRDFHMRLKYASANTFEYYYSPDGISWTLVHTRTITMTPAYIGIAGSTYGGSTPFIFSFDYFRYNP